MSFETFEVLVKEWATERKILPRGDAARQLMKAQAEMGELFDAELKGNFAGCSDGVGDVLVCLINYCELKGLKIVDCLAMSYSEIKDRTGKTNSSGVFVKDEKLP